MVAVSDINTSAKSDLAKVAVNKEIYAKNDLYMIVGCNAFRQFGV